MRQNACRLALVLTLPLLAAAAPQGTTNPAVPDWALPGSPTHKQVPPPAGFHRPSRTEMVPLGVFDGQSDIGSAVVPGASSYNAATGTYTVSSAGYNIWYSRDEFRFVWKKMSGDVSLAADGSFADPQGYDDRKVVLVIRQSLDDDASETVVGEHATGMIHLAQRAETDAQMNDAQYRFGGTLATIKAKRIGIQKRGNQVALFISLQGEPLHQFGPPIETHFTGPFYVGIGFCSHLPAQVATATFSNVVLKNQADALN